MIVTLDIFKQAVQLLKDNTFDLVMRSLESVQTHRFLTNNKYQKEMHDLKTMFVKFRQYQNQYALKKGEIWYKETEPWIPLLKIHQQTTVFPAVKKETVEQISKSKKATERIDDYVAELQLRLVAKAKVTKDLLLTLKTTDARIFILETAIDLYSFLEQRKYQAGNIADYEVAKYYEQFMKEGASVG